MNRWTRVKRLERRRSYADVVSSDGRFTIAEGYDELARTGGLPYTLLERGRCVGTFGSVRTAKSAAGGGRS